MGQQYSTRLGSTIKDQNKSTKSTNNSSRVSPKTSFHYIHPIKCESQQNPHCEQFPDEQIDMKTQQAEYWQIENNHQQQHELNSKKDLEKIEQIKVKWNQFIKMKKRNYLEDYSVLKQIGRGGFGCVHKVKARYTGLYRAAKRIKKAQLKKSQHQKLFQQMAIMISLDHPNIAKLYEVYDYKSYYVLILELCEGGELFKKIVTKQLNEDISARIMKQILWTLIYLHKKGILHRDLKPENMLFELESDMIKIIDFGIAVKKKPNEVLTARLGTPYYIAPQVLCKNYGQKCDLWSAGVILFMMISGYPPFRGDNQYEVMENVLKQPVMFKGAIWTKVTPQCKNLISMMLKKNPQQRPSAQQAYNHPWIKKVIQSTKSLKQQNILANIREFSFDNKLQAVVYTYIVSQLLTSNQKKVLFQTFKDLDKNNDGVIESAQLAQALRQRKEISQSRVKFLVRVIDTNGSGHIDYTEFLVAGLNPKISLNQSHFQQAFQYFDIDHSGAITFEQIAFFLQNTKQSQQSIKRIFQQVDENNDGNISKQEFVKLLMQATKKKLTSLTMIKPSQDEQMKRKKTNNNTRHNSSYIEQSQTNSQAQKRASKAVVMPDTTSQSSSSSKRMSQMVVHEKSDIEKRDRSNSAVKENQVPASVFSKLTATGNINSTNPTKKAPQVLRKPSKEGKQIYVVSPVKQQQSSKIKKTQSKSPLAKQKQKSVSKNAPIQKKQNASDNKDPKGEKRVVKIKV